MRSASSPFSALRTGLRIALGGRRFLSAAKYLVHFLAEGADSRELRMNLRRIRRSVGERATEVANATAEFVRAVPFPDPMVVSPAGQRLLPLHAIVPYTRAEALHQEYLDYMAGMRKECQENGVEAYVVYSTSGRGGFLYEVVIYWSDEWLDYHRHYLPDELRGAATEGPSNPEGRALVERLREDLIEIMYRHGGAHLQIGRAYPYARDRNPAALELLRAMKRKVDPHGLINPGALGI